MQRTKNRPLPSKIISINTAKTLNMGLFLASNLILLVNNINPMSIILSNVTYFSYIIYIKLKPVSSLNTVFGAIVGSLPILIGFTAN